MLEAVIQDLIRQQRPYYLLQGNSVKGVGGQYLAASEKSKASNDATTSLTS
jgi:hypothetical protein